MFAPYAVVVFLAGALSHPLDHCELSVLRLPQGGRREVSSRSTPRVPPLSRGWPRRTDSNEKLSWCHTYRGAGATLIEVRGPTLIRVGPTPR